MLHICSGSPESLPMPSSLGPRLTRRACSGTLLAVTGATVRFRHGRRAGETHGLQKKVSPAHCLAAIDWFKSHSPAWSPRRLINQEGGMKRHQMPVNHSKHLISIFCINPRLRRIPPTLAFTYARDALALTSSPPRVPFGIHPAKYRREGGKGVRTLVQFPRLSRKVTSRGCGDTPPGARYLRSAPAIADARARAALPSTPRFPS